MKVFRPLRKPPQPKRFLAVDTEDDNDGNVTLVSMSGDVAEGVFDDRLAAITYLMTLHKKEDDVVAVCHNLEYDLINLFWGTNLFDRAALWFSGQGLVMADVNGLRFIDSYKHAPFPLARLGEIVGIKKLDFDPHDPDYALTDARIAFDYMNRAQDEYLDLGAETKSTIPATAMDLFRRKYLSFALPVFEDDVIEFFRSGYYGGRTEAFYIGELEGDLRFYDVNSMYPYAMQGPFPDLWKLKHSSNPDLDDYGMVEALIRVRNQKFPLLAHRYNRKLIFPVGRWKGVYTTVELRTAIEAGYEVKPLQGWTTAVTVHPFKEYVHDLYAMRKEAKARGNVIKDTVFKLLMNSLYGKFGAGKEFIAIVDRSDVPEHVKVIETYGRKAMVVAEDEYPPYANAVWAAWVTARSRILLWQYLKDADAFGDVLYCDTDSVMVKVRKEPPFGKSDDLGALSLDKTARYTNIILPKVYQFGEKFKAKGARNAKHFIQEGFDVVKAPVRLREGLKRGLRPNVWVQKVKTIRSGYNKRTVLPSGWTKPLRISPKTG